MSGKFLSRVDLAAAKREMEIFNSMLKRGDVRNPDDILREHYVVCGCGAPGCGFISCDRNKKNCRNSFKTKDFWTAVRFRPAPPKVLTPIAGD